MVDKYNRRFTDKELIAELHRFYEENGRTPTQKDMCSKNGYPSFKTYENHFGSWNKALEKAGLKLNNYVGYTKDFLLSELKRFVSEYNTIPTLETFNNDKSYPSSGAFRQHFDTWNHALIEAGLQVNNFTEYTSELLISEIYRFIEENDRVPSFDDMCSGNGYPHATTYSSHFGTWSNALIVAGVDKKDYFKKYLISELLRFVDNEGHIPSAPEMKRENGYPAKNTYARYFGTWNNSLIEAGLELNRPNYTDDELIQYIQDFVYDQGRVPLASDFSGEIYPSSVTYSERFGSWNESLIIAGFDINKVYCYTDEQLLEKLQEYFNEYNKTPTIYDFYCSDRWPSPNSYRVHFGTWNNGIEQAGLEVNNYFHFKSDDDCCAICGTTTTHRWRYNGKDLLCSTCWDHENIDIVQERRHKRRGYGFNPINYASDYCNAHHLHLENDSSFVVYIPEFIHQLHGHNSNIPNSMITINALALDYWVNEDFYNEIYYTGGE